METLQLHGLYLIAIGTLMARHNKSAALVSQGQYNTEIQNMMVARGASVEEAERQIARVYPADAINAQF